MHKSTILYREVASPPAKAFPLTPHSLTHFFFGNETFVLVPASCQVSASVCGHTHYKDSRPHRLLYTLPFSLNPFTMAEGGRFPWKLQKIWSRPTADYSGLRNPLPSPPEGMTWHQDPETKEYKLVKMEVEEEEQAVVTAISPTPELAAEHHLLQVDTLPPLHSCRDQSSSVTGTGDDEWELLSDRVSSSSQHSQYGSIFVPKVGSVRSIASMEAQSRTSSSHTQTLSLPFKIQRTASSSTIDSKDNALGPAGKGVLGVDYVEHVILPTDTLQGICLAYKITSTRLRQANHFSGNSLLLAPKKLVIPLSKKALRSGFIRVQDTDAKEYKLHAFLAEFADLSMTEAKAYVCDTCRC